MNKIVRTLVTAWTIRSNSAWPRTAKYAGDQATFGPHAAGGELGVGQFAEPVLAW